MSQSCVTVLVVPFPDSLKQVVPSFSVMYLQANPGGITIFGWTVDRGLINTIFFIQLSLMTYVLGKTIVVIPE